MTLLDYREKGIINDLIQKGVISCKYITYLEMYDRFKEYTKSNSRRQSYILTSIDFNVSEQTVYRAIKSVKS